MIDIIINGVQTLGAVLIGITALGVHHRVLNERKIDAEVVTFMKKEQKIGITGMVLIVVGFVLEVVITLM